jgi:hypothetical protein
MALSQLLEHTHALGNNFGSNPIAWNKRNAIGHGYLLTEGTKEQRTKEQKDWWLCGPEPLFICSFALCFSYAAFGASTPRKLNSSAKWQAEN